MNNSESDVKGAIAAFYFAEALQSQHHCVVQKRIGSYEACQYSAVMDPRQFSDLPMASTAQSIFKKKRAFFTVSFHTPVDKVQAH